MKRIIHILFLFFALNSCAKAQVSLLGPQYTGPNKTVTTSQDGKYVSFGTPIALNDSIIRYFLRGNATSHIANGAMGYKDYHIRNRTLGSFVTIATPPTGQDYRNGNGGPLMDEKIILFTCRYVTAAGTFASLGYFLSTDMTSNNFGTYQTLAFPTGITRAVHYGSMIESDVEGTYYQPCYGLNDAQTLFMVWLWKIEYAAGAVTISRIDVYSGAAKITESCIERLGDGRFIMICRENGRSGLWQTISSDGGNTWSAMTLTNLSAGATGPNDATIDFMADIKLMNGKLYVIWQDRVTGYLMVSRAKPDRVFASATAWPEAQEYVLNTKSATSYIFLGYPVMCIIPGYTDRMAIFWHYEVVNTSQTGTKVVQDDFSQLN